MATAIGLLILGLVALVGEIVLAGTGHLAGSMETTLTSIVTLAAGGGAVGAGHQIASNSATDQELAQVPQIDPPAAG